MKITEDKIYEIITTNLKTQVGEAYCKGQPYGICEVSGLVEAAEEIIKLIEEGE